MPQVPPQAKRSRPQRAVTHNLGLPRRLVHPVRSSGWGPLAPFSNTNTDGLWVDVLHNMRLRRASGRPRTCADEAPRTPPPQRAKPHPELPHPLPMPSPPLSHFLPPGRCYTSASSCAVILTGGWHSRKSALLSLDRPPAPPAAQLTPTIHTDHHAPSPRGAAISTCNRGAARRGSDPFNDVREFFYSRFFSLSCIP